MPETVKEHCKHKDCMYRGWFANTPCCNYLIITGRLRDCDISACDKYRAGKVRVKSTFEGVLYEYEDDL